MTSWGLGRAVSPFPLFFPLSRAQSPWGDLCAPRCSLACHLSTVETTTFPCGQDSAGPVASPALGEAARGLCSLSPCRGRVSAPPRGGPARHHGSESGCRFPGGLQSPQRGRVEGPSSRTLAAELLGRSLVTALTPFSPLATTLSSSGSEGTRAAAWTRGAGRPRREAPFSPRTVFFGPRGHTDVFLGPHGDCWSEKTLSSFLGQEERLLSQRKSA